MKFPLDILTSKITCNSVGIIIAKSRDTVREWIAVPTIGFAKFPRELFQNFPSHNRNDTPRLVEGNREKEMREETRKKPCGSLIASEMHSALSEQ